MSRFPRTPQPDPLLTWAAVAALLLAMASGATDLLRDKPAPHVYPCDATWAPQDCPPFN